MIEEIERNPFTTAVDLFKNSSINHNEVGVSSIKSLLKEEGYFEEESPIDFLLVKQTNKKD